jgi:hypothetical protein
MPSASLLSLPSNRTERWMSFVTTMRKRRIPGSRSALWRFLDRHGITIKKKPARSRATRADVARARRRRLKGRKQLPILKAALAAHQVKHTTKQKLEQNPQAA